MKRMCGFRTLSQVGSPLSMLLLSVPGLDNVAGGSGLQAKDYK